MYLYYSTCTIRLRSAARSHFPVAFRTTNSRRAAAPSVKHYRIPTMCERLSHLSRIAIFRLWAAQPYRVKLNLTYRILVIKICIVSRVLPCVSGFTPTTQPCWLAFCFHSSWCTAWQRLPLLLLAFLATQRESLPLGICLSIAFA